MSYLLHYCLSLRPFVFHVRHPPSVESSDNSVDNLLFFAGLGEVCATFLIETNENLLQSIDGVILDVMANLLETLQWHVTMLKRGEVKV